MTEIKALLLLIALVVASAAATTGEIRGDCPSTSLTAGAADGDRQRVAVPGGSSYTVRRQRGGASNDSSTTTASGVPADQWRNRERNKQTRLFMIQRYIMEVLGPKRRPVVPRRRDRNATDAEMERLLPLLQQGDDDALNATTPTLYVVKRVHALLPTCQLQRQQRPHQLCTGDLTPASQSEQSLDADDDTSRSQTASRSGQRSRSGSRPMRLYFDTAELTVGTRRHLVSVKSAVLRLHWTGNASSHRRSRDGRRDVTGQRVLARRRRPPGDGPETRTWNSTALRILVYQLTASSPATGSGNRSGGRRLVKSVRLRATDEPRWISVDVKSAVERWLRKPRRNHGLQVYVVRDAASRGRRRKYDSLSVLDGYDCCVAADNSLDDVTDRKNVSRAATTAATSPALDVIVLQRSGRRRSGVVPGNRRRPRRRRRPGDRRGPRDRRDVIGSPRACAMGTMRVSFAELGWDDVIVLPKAFVTGYCHGSCLIQDDSASHGEQHSTNGNYCVPSELGSLSVIRLNEHNQLEYDVLPDIIVTRCDCLG